MIKEVEKRFAEREVPQQLKAALIEEEFDCGRSDEYRREPSPLNRYS
jgi:hypothetical protein